MSNALAVFSDDEAARVQRLLALRVAQMMGRKMEENDWTSVYCAAKGIPNQGWSNLDIDVMHGPLGVEHKMLCYRSKPSLLEACGTRLMHPSATRSLRLRNLHGDPGAEMAHIFTQYGALLDSRRIKVARHGGVPVSQVDLRTGWLLWQVSLREFIYFEEATTTPNAGDYYAEWSEKADGKRKGSRNLWIFDLKTGVKRYSLTTSAGIKLQPYFDVPGAKDPNLCHWTIIGEVIDTGDVRIWLTSRTANALQDLVGSLEKDDVTSFILEAISTFEIDVARVGSVDDLNSVIEVVISSEAYAAMYEVFPSANDNHLIQQLVDESMGSSPAHGKPRA